MSTVAYAMRMAFAAAAMARGLDAVEAQIAWEIMCNNTVPESVSQAWNQMDAALTKVSNGS